MPYSIIIPIHNEQSSLPKLLSELHSFSYENELLFVNDGSDDESLNILSNCNYINLISLDKNYGKGYAIKIALKRAKYDKIIITDGDLELETSQLSNFMKLNQKNNFSLILGSRYNKESSFKSLWDIGNYIFTILFNLIHKSDLSDSLCCAKSFYKHDIDLDNIKSTGFDIDIEITSNLIKKYGSYKQVSLIYNRRSLEQGKKLQIIDTLTILSRMLRML